MDAAQFAILESKVREFTTLFNTLATIDNCEIRETLLKSLHALIHAIQPVTIMTSKNSDVNYVI
jgi:hypothetical protein